jgi:hypothetical protein
VIYLYPCHENVVSAIKEATPGDRGDVEDKIVLVE